MPLHFTRITPAGVINFIQSSMTYTEPQVFRRTRRRSRRTPAQKAWIWFVLLLACGCVTLFMFSFSWDDSHVSEPSHTQHFYSPPVSPGPPSTPPAYDFPAPAGGSAEHVASKVYPVDGKLVKEFESKFGAETSGSLSVEGHEHQSDAPAIVPTQSARQGR
jgi:hypothetical protein